MKKMDPPEKLRKQEFALAGNRTPASCVAGENSTTEPPMLDKLSNYHCRIIAKGRLTNRFCPAKRQCDVWGGGGSSL